MRDMRAVVSGEWEAERSVEGGDEGEGVGLGLFGRVGGWWRRCTGAVGVEGIGMAAAFSCRAAKSARSRPRGRVGGQTRCRLGVDGAVVAWFCLGVERLSLSESEWRRFLDAGGGVCGCGAFVTV